MKPSDQTKAEEFCRAAEKRIRWSTRAAQEMRSWGSKCDRDEIERAFSQTLVHIASAHDTLEAATKAAGASSQLNGLEQLRKSDPLLNYVWMARNVEVHAPLIVRKGRTREFNFEIVDKSKAHPIAYQFQDPFNVPDEQARERLLMYVFEATSDIELMLAIMDGALPNPQRLETAGVRIDGLLDSLLLPNFTTRINGKTVHIAQPLSHLGKPFAPSAIGAVEKANCFYVEQLSLLHNHLAGASPGG